MFSRDPSPVCLIRREGGSKTGAPFSITSVMTNGRGSLGELASKLGLDKSATSGQLREAVDRATSSILRPVEVGRRGSSLASRCLKCLKLVPERPNWRVIVILHSSVAEGMTSLIPAAGEFRFAHSVRFLT